jgi:hypothetical protein
VLTPIVLGSRRDQAGVLSDVKDGRANGAVPSPTNGAVPTPQASSTASDL